MSTLGSGSIIFDSCGLLLVAARQRGDFQRGSAVFTTDAEFPLDRCQFRFLVEQSAQGKTDPAPGSSYYNTGMMGGMPSFFLRSSGTMQMPCRTIARGADLQFPALRNTCLMSAWPDAEQAGHQFRPPRANQPGNAEISPRRRANETLSTTLRSGFVTSQQLADGRKITIMVMMAGVVVPSSASWRYRPVADDRHSIGNFCRFVQLVGRYRRKPCHLRLEVLIEIEKDARFGRRQSRCRLVE